MINRANSRLLRGFGAMLLCLYLFNLSVVTIVHPLVHLHDESHKIDPALALAQQNLSHAEHGSDCPFCHITVANDYVADAVDYQFIAAVQLFSILIPTHLITFLPLRTSTLVHRLLADFFSFYYNL